MQFCWFTSFLGYPDFFATSGHGAELAKTFLKLGGAAKGGISYDRAKTQFGNLDPHQVETKKAAFQEFGLLYVIPRSNEISLTPLGEQVLALCARDVRRKRVRKAILISLVRGLARYQFANPLPVGGNSVAKQKRANSTDVRPYLACYWLMNRLDGMLTASELRGSVFGLQERSDLARTARLISRARRERSTLAPLRGLPERPGTAENLKIYFMAHLGAANHIAAAVSGDPIYGANDQVWALTALGSEITQAVLDDQWPEWRESNSKFPAAKKYESIESYFTIGVGEACPEQLLALDSAKGEYQVSAVAGLEAGLEQDAIESLKKLPKREYEEGRAKLVSHVRIERTRSAALAKNAKREHKRTHGKLVCEVCEFNFEVRYGERGQNYIEAHHRVPISKLEVSKSTRMTTKDIALVCANCHRMLHRVPWVSVEKLREDVKPHLDHSQA